MGWTVGTLSSIPERTSSRLDSYTPMLITRCSMACIWSDQIIDEYICKVPGRDFTHFSICFVSDGGSMPPIIRSVWQYVFEVLDNEYDNISFGLVRQYYGRRKTRRYSWFLEIIWLDALIHYCAHDCLIVAFRTAFVARQRSRQNSISLHVEL